MAGGRGLGIVGGISGDDAEQTLAGCPWYGEWSTVARAMMVTIELVALVSLDEFLMSM
jgi:hypothetical protein